MIRKYLLTLALFLLFLLFSTCAAAIITLQPQDVTTLLGNTAVFNCTGEGGLLQWTREGDSITEEIKQQYQISIVDHTVSDGMVSSSLYINATIENDGITIACLVVTPGVASAGGDLYVRRISPVRDLSLSIDDVPYVTWTIPSVIATDIPVSDIRYTVTLEGGNFTSTANDIDDTYYQFTEMKIPKCVNSSSLFIATVEAYATVGDETHRSHEMVITNATIGANATLAVTATEVHMLNDSACYCIFSILVTSECHQEVVQGFTRFNKSDNLTSHEKTNIYNPPKLINYATEPLTDLQRSGAIFIAVAYGDELLGEIRSSFSTFHVQNFTISNATNNDGINITCIFAIGSNATGCRVDLTRNGYQQNITVQKDSFTVTAVPDGTYDVTVCDIVGSDIAVAITTIATIINVPVYTDTPALATPVTTDTPIVATTDYNITNYSTDIPTMEVMTSPSSIVVGSIIGGLVMVLVVVAIVITAVVCVRSSHYRKQRKVDVRGDMAALHISQAHYNHYDVGDVAATLTHVRSHEVASSYAAVANEDYYVGTQEFVTGRSVPSATSPLYHNVNNDIEQTHSSPNEVPSILFDSKPGPTRTQYADIATLPASTVPVPSHDEPVQYTTITPHDVVKEQHDDSVAPPIPPKKAPVSDEDSATDSSTSDSGYNSNGASNSDSNGVDANGDSIFGSSNELASVGQLDKFESIQETSTGSGCSIPVATVEPPVQPSSTFDVEKECKYESKHVTATTDGDNDKIVANEPIPIQQDITSDDRFIIPKPWAQKQVVMVTTIPKGYIYNVNLTSCTATSVLDESEGGMVGMSAAQEADANIHCEMVGVSGPFIAQPPQEEHITLAASSNSCGAICQAMNKSNSLLVVVSNCHVIKGELEEVGNNTVYSTNSYTSALVEFVKAMYQIMVYMCACVLPKWLCEALKYFGSKTVISACGLRCGGFDGGGNGGGGDDGGGGGMTKGGLPSNGVGAGECGDVNGYGISGVLKGIYCDTLNDICQLMDYYSYMAKAKLCTLTPNLDEKMCKDITEPRRKSVYYDIIYHAQFMLYVKEEDKPNASYREDNPESCCFFGEVMKSCRLMLPLLLLVYMLEAHGVPISSKAG